MSIEIDWEIVEEDVPEPQRPSPPAARPRARWPHAWVIVLAAMVLLAGAGVVGYAAWVVRVQTDKVAREIRPVAKLEEQAVMTNDLSSFMTLQDTGDPTWLAFQEKRFGRLEREGLPEFGWNATGLPPQLGKVTLEPGGARLDVTYQFSVTQPMPKGPKVIALTMPHYYRQTPSGWLRANPGGDYWGPWLHRSGKLFAARYMFPDAEVIVPLIPRMDMMLSKLCDTLRCPPQPIFISFDNSPELALRLSDFTYGFDDSSFILYLPSPHLIGLPANAAARDEFYRMVATRVVQALVVETSGRRLNMNSFPPRLLLQWELTKAGLSGPFITPEISQTLVSSLQTATWPLLSAIPLRSRTLAAVTTEDVAAMSLAFVFLEGRFGTGSVERLIPSMQSNATLGEAINAVWKFSPASLEPERVAFLRRQAGLPFVAPLPPSGELSLWCAENRTNFSIVRVRAAGGVIQTLDGQNMSRPTWSPDGQKLAYLQGRQLMVLDALYQRAKPVASSYSIGSFGWLPDGRLHISSPGVARMSSHVLNLDTGQDIELPGTGHVWSPDGQRVVFLRSIPGASGSPASQGNVAIWVADANGDDGKQISLGFSPVWSSDSKRIAFFSALGSGPGFFIPAGEIRVADVTSGSIATLVRASDLVQSANQSSWIGNMAWSPDGSMLAVALNQPNGPTVFALAADTGAVRAMWHGTVVRWLSLAWSADSRYVGFWTVPSASRDATTGIVGALNVATGQAATIAGRDFDWSPDSKWLAVPQDPAGVLLVAPDLSAISWLEAPSCSGVAWRPELP